MRFSALAVFLFSFLLPRAQQIIEVKDSLVIEKNTVYRNTEFRFNEGAVMIARKNASLVLYGCQLHSSGNKNWQGIQLKNGAGLQLKNCQLSDALFAVQTIGRTGNIIIEHNQFERNCCAIQIYMPVFYGNKKISIVQNHITVNPVGKGGVGINISSHASLPFGRNVAIDVRGNKITLTNGFAGIYISNLYSTIYGTGTNLNPNTRLTNNTIYLNDPANNEDGMLLSNSNGLYVRENTVIGSTTNSSNTTTHMPRGFTLQNTTGTALNYLYCNTAYNTHTGFRVESTCNNTDFMGNNIGLNSTGNYIGLHVTNMNSQIGAQSNKGNKWYGSYTGSNNNWSAWNEMPLTTLVGGIYVSNPFSLQSSQFKMPLAASTSPTNPSGLLPIYPPNGSAPPGVDWFVPGPTVTDPCLTLSNPPAFFIHPPSNSNSSPRALDAFELSVITGDYQPVYFATTNLWEAQNSVYKHLDNTVQNNNKLGTTEQYFYDSLNNQTIGQFAAVQNALQDTSAYTLALRIAAYEKQIIYDSLWSEQLLLDSALANGADSVETTAQIQALDTPMLSVITAVDSFYTLLDSVHRNHIAVARSVNAAITTSAMYEQYHKTVNEIALKAEAETALPNDTAVEQLVEIATKCYLEYGSAVLEARGLLSAFDTRSFNEFDNCITGNSYKTDETENSQQTIDDRPQITADTAYRLYPNPANGSISIQKTEGTFTDEEITIIDAQGKIMAMFNTASKGSIVQLSTKFLSPANYFCRISRKAKTIAVLSLKIAR